MSPGFDLRRLLCRERSDLRENGQVQEQNCAADGQACGTWSAGNSYYVCTGGSVTPEPSGTFPLLCEEASGEEGTTGGEEGTTGGEEGTTGGEEGATGGGTTGGGGGCPDGLTFEGCCDGLTLQYCENNSVETLNCDSGCGWEWQRRLLRLCIGGSERFG